MLILWCNAGLPLHALLSPPKLRGTWPLHPCHPHGPIPTFPEEKANVPVPKHCPLSCPCSPHAAPALRAATPGQTLRQAGTPCPALCYHPPPKLDWAQPRRQQDLCA